METKTAIAATVAALMLLSGCDAIVQSRKDQKAFAKYEREVAAAQAALDDVRPKEDRNEVMQLDSPRVVRAFTTYTPPTHETIDFLHLIPFRNKHGKGDPGTSELIRTLEIPRGATVTCTEAIVMQNGAPDKWVEVCKKWTVTP
jgi:hypothetical protein